MSTIDHNKLLAAQAFLAELTWRGYIHQHTATDSMAEWMASVDYAPAYIGFDATASTLHVGSLLQLLLLRKWQHHGFKPVLLIGGGTTRIGDPSGKDASREMLSIEQIDNNARSLQNLTSRFLEFGDNKGGTGDARAIMCNNAEWLPKLNYIDFLREYGRHFSVNRMLGFESVQTRLAREQHLSFIEFNYMIFQAYDFLELSRRYGVLLQFGGSDQWGNITNGIDLIRKCTGKAAHCLTTPLLTTASGKKMGKTETGAVWLDAERTSPFDFWQHWRNTEDGDVVRFFKLFTELDQATIEGIASEITHEQTAGTSAAAINAAKTLLATEVTRICHGDEVAEEMASIAAKQQSGRASPAHSSTHIDASAFPAPDTFVLALPQQALPLLDLLADTLQAVASKGEARRLIRNRGLRINDQIISDEAHSVQRDDMLPIAETTDAHGIVVGIGKKQRKLVVFATDPDGFRKPS